MEGKELAGHGKADNEKAKPACQLRSRNCCVKNDKNQFVTSHIFRVGQKLLLLAAIFLGSDFSATAFTSNDVTTIVNAYTKAFYVPSGTNAYLMQSQTNRVSTDFWRLANEIECVLDAYEWTSNTTQKAMAARLLNGFLDRNGNRWAKNHYNDDIMWACMAFARGYLDTGNATYRDIAKTNFDLCYARAWDTNGALVPPVGGMYWTTTNNTKNACVNFPGAIAANLLYQCLGDTGYYNTSSNIYFWGRSNLFDAASGRVYDSLRRHGATTYNQGTFIGAANFLGQTNDAILAANFTMNAMTKDGILPRYGIKRNNSIFNAIFIRWMTKFMKERQLQGTYQPWLQANAAAAWKGRRLSDNLSWCQWPEPTPPGVNLCSYDCIASFEAMLAVPPTEKGSQ